MLNASKVPLEYPRIVLPAYPSCEECLAWSEDGLAVAVGENVFLLDGSFDVDRTGKHNVNWKTTLIRVDQFSQDQWPERSLTTLRNLSLGEEQSNSLIVALSWSSPGLGLHKRSVLAVLTSNLLLSIWETNGLRRGWRRTLIINDSLANDTIAQDTSTELYEARRRSRIRAFSWLEPLFTNTQSRWGEHFLITVDDDSNLILLRMSKSKRLHYGNWSASVVCTAKVPEARQVAAQGRVKTNLESNFSQRSPIEHVKVANWQVHNAVSLNGLPQISATTKITLQSFLIPEERTVNLQVVVNGEDICGRFQTSDTTSPPPTDDDFVMNASGCPHPQNRSCRMVYDLEQLPQWRLQLLPVITDYNTKHCLGGFFRLRLWGSAKSPQKNTEAMCVTLHPWDMFEYTSAVNENSHLLFRPLAESIPPNAVQCKTSLEVLKQVIQFITEWINRHEFPKSPIDVQIIQLMSAWSNTDVETNVEHSTLEGILTNLNSGAAASDKVKASDAQTLADAHAQKSSITVETCSICANNISMQANIDTATCDSGHVFTRCSLTLYAIQLPGVSKYCSRCGKQFLNLLKLGSVHDQDLVAAVFDEFDLCPYCGAKYRD